MSSNIEKLGYTINKRMHAVNKATRGLSPEIGTVTDYLGLHVNSVKNTIPRGDYMMSAELVLSPGDRVLVIWCDYEPVVTAVLIDS